MADAATIKPKFVPDEALKPRDDSGGISFEPYTQQWDDGGYVTGGAKAHLSASGGKGVDAEGGEESSMPRRRDAIRAKNRSE